MSKQILASVICLIIISACSKSGGDTPAPVPIPPQPIQKSDIALTITEFSPSKGKVGDTIIIKGSGFGSVLGDLSFSVNSTKAQIITNSFSDISIKAIIASGTITGTNKITATRQETSTVKSATTQSANLFTVENPKVDTVWVNKRNPDMLNCYGVFTVDTATNKMAATQVGRDDGRVIKTELGGTTSINLVDAENATTRFYNETIQVIFPATSSYMKYLTTVPTKSGNTVTITTTETHLYFAKGESLNYYFNNQKRYTFTPSMSETIGIIAVSNHKIILYTP
jgi:hypothetical protein